MKEEERKRVIEVSKSSIWKLKKENIIKVLGNCNGQLSFFFNDCITSWWYFTRYLKNNMINQCQHNEIQN